MSLLLHMDPREARSAEQTNVSQFEISSWSQQRLQVVDPRERQRGLTRKAIFERKYKQIIDTRLSHLPAKLPFPRSSIISRLKEVDRFAPNWAQQEQLLEIETDLALIQRDLTGKGQDDAGRPKPRARRLKAIWDFLSLSAQRFQQVVEQREGRLNFNVGLFFRSDLPPSYLADIGEGTQWELAALVIAANAEAERLVHGISSRGADQVSEDDFLEADLSLHDIEAVFRGYTRRLGKVTSISDRVLEWRDAIEYYVDLFSADDMSVFRTPREISLSSLDPEVLRYLSTGMHGAVQDLRSKLAAEYPTELSKTVWSPMDPQFLSDLLLVESEPLG